MASTIWEIFVATRCQAMESANYCVHRLGRFRSHPLPSGGNVNDGVHRLATVATSQALRGKKPNDLARGDRSALPYRGAVTHVQCAGLASCRGK